MLTTGKLRGLQQIASSADVFTMCAMDHRESLLKAISEQRHVPPSYEAMVEFKQELCEVLAPLSSAVLLDPIYGAAQCISRGVLGRGTGLLVSVEASGYGGGKENRVTRILDGWGVEKIKRMGASAVKILVYYRPDLGELSSRQIKTVGGIAGDCIRYDIPFLVEPVSYPVGPEVADAEEFARNKPPLVIATARDITTLPLDVLKAEFPADLRYEKDKEKLLDLCRQLNQASRVPWVILSGGVDYDRFIQQVEIACKAGASGFLAGRAIWQEVIPITDAGDRRKWLNTVARDRVKELVETAGKYATPWPKRLEQPAEKTVAVTENWHREYPGMAG